MKERQEMVQGTHKTLSKRKRALLLGVNLSSCYVRKKPLSKDTVDLMNEIREIYEARPFQGYRRITWDLKDLGFGVNHKKVYRLMQLMGLQAVYPKKNLSKRRQGDVVHPYLLKDYPPKVPHDVWCVDITYIKTANGFVYLTALIDVVSRCVMGFHVSPFLDTESCLNALEMAINQGYKPSIINSDQGCQFTSQDWRYALSLLGIKISMDGKGRCLDNIPVERFFRTIKYEEVYLKTYDTVQDAKRGIASYINWYNHHRRHMGLNKHRPYEVMTGKQTALKWSFSKDNGRADGFVDNGEPLSHNPTATTTASERSKQLKDIKNRNLSSKLAA